MKSIFMLFPAEPAGGSVMACGGFACDGAADLSQTHGHLKLHGYRSILQRHTDPSALWLVGQSFIVLQDHNQTCLVKLNKNSQEEIERERQLKLMTWPIQSAERRPIDLIKDEVERKTKSNQSCPQAPWLTAVETRHSIFFAESC